MEINTLFYKNKRKEKRNNNKQREQEEDERKKRKEPNFQLTAPKKERGERKSRRTTSDHSQSIHGKKNSKKETFRDGKSVSCNLAFFLSFFHAFFVPSLNKTVSCA